MNIPPSEDLKLQTSQPFVMSKKTTGFDLSTVILGKCLLAHHINYHVASFDFYVQRTLHHVSKHNLISRTNQFKDKRCKK